MATSSRQQLPLLLLRLCLPVPASIATNCGKVFAQQIELGLFPSPSSPSSPSPLQLHSCVNLLYFIFRYFILYFPSVTCSQFVMQFYWLRTCFNLSSNSDLSTDSSSDSGSDSGSNSDSRERRPRVNCRNGETR